MVGNYQFFILYIIDVEDYAREIGAICIETSALTAVNVPQLFESIGKK